MSAGEVPRSLPTAVRDLAGVAVTAFVLGGALDAATAQLERLETVRHTTRIVLADIPFQWAGVLRDDGGWTREVVLWAAVCWCAGRVRSGHRTRWLPAVLAVLLVAARSVAGLLHRVAVLWSFDGLWPGPFEPYRWDDAGYPSLSAAHPAWGFPVLAAGLLVAAAALGVRAGRLPDDAASRHLPPVARAGLPVAAAVVGLPALGVTAGTVAAYLTLTRREELGGNAADGLVGQLLLPLLVAAVAAALLSGTGPLGVVVTALTTLRTAWQPVSTWLAGSDDLLLAQAAGMAAVCVVVALWRPCLAWGGTIVAPALATEPSPLPTPPPGDPERP